MVCFICGIGVVALVWFLVEVVVGFGDQGGLGKLGHQGGRQPFGVLRGLGLHGLQRWWWAALGEIHDGSGLGGL